MRSNEELLALDEDAPMSEDEWRLLTALKSNREIEEIKERLDDLERKNRWQRYLKGC